MVSNKMKLKIKIKERLYKKFSRFSSRVDATGVLLATLID